MNHEEFDYLMSYIRAIEVALCIIAGSILGLVIVIVIK